MRKFEEEDYFTIQEWFARRLIKAPLKEMLPPTGLIEDGLAAGFLIKTDTPAGVLDFFISNPQANRLNRLEAIYDVAQGLIVSAKQAGIKSLICSTRFSNVKQIAIKHGFDFTCEESVFIKELM